MKNYYGKRFINVIIICLFTIQCSKKSEEGKIIGEWKAVGEERNISIIFDETQHAILVMDNLVIGGNDFKISDDKKAELIYEIDETKTPAKLDFVIYEKGNSTEKGRITGIFRYLTDDKIEWRMNLKGKRPTEFDSSDKSSTGVLERHIVK